MLTTIRSFALIVLWSLALTAAAQTPDAINYQGVVRDGNGQLLTNATLSAQFTIKENGPAGATIYQETHNVTTNDYGLFTALIGQGTAQAGTFNQISWGSNSMFLKVEVDNGGGWIDLGTTQMVSVPYALYAKEAGNGGGNYQAGSGIDITGNTISNTAPDQQVTITGGGATTVGGGYPNFTISSTDQVDDADNNPANELQSLTLSGNTLSITQGNSITLPTGTAGDNWGSQVVQSDATLEGDGTGINRLSIARQGAGNGEVLKWDGTAWIPAADDNTTYNAGSGLTLNGTTFNNTGDTDATDDVTLTTQAGGDVSGAFQNMTVEALQGQPVAATAPAASDVLKWNGSAWAPSLDTFTTDTSHWEKSGQYLYTLGDSVGIAVAAPQATLHIDSGGSFFIGDTMVRPSGNVLLFDSKTGAFRAGVAVDNKWDTNSIGINSFASGTGTIASGTSAVAMGDDTYATGNYSTAMGYATDASGDYSTAMGFYTDASGDYSTAMGYNNTASGPSSTAMGYNTSASGPRSTAMGSSTIASGDYSTAMGRTTTASGLLSTAMGSYTVAQSFNETVIGRYNLTYTPASTTTWNPNDRLFIIGNGTSNASPSNAMVVLKNGNTGIGNNDPETLLHVGTGTGAALRIGSFETIEDAGSNRLSINASFVPSNDNFYDLGRATNRWDDVYATNGVIQTSDGRDKKSILTLDYGLQTLLQLKPVSFVWKEGYTNGGRKLGFLAQDLLNTIPEVVKTEDLVRNEDGTTEIVQLDRYGVYYADLIPVLVKGIQEQQSTIEAQENYINTMQLHVQQMQQQIADMQQAIEQLQQ